PGRRETLQPLPGQFRVIEVAIAVRKLLIERARHRELIVFFSQTGAPIEGRRSFSARGIERDLFFEGFLGILVAALPQGEPRGLPMHVGSSGTIRKALLRLTKCVEGLVILVMDQMQVGS